MPTNKDTFQRYVILDPLLADQNHYYDIHDLTNRVNRHLRNLEKPEVSERTIEYDIKALEGDPFYIKIDHPRKEGKRCICYADPTFAIFNKKLTDEEKNLLREVLNTLGQFDGLESLSWFDNLKTRLNIKDSLEPPIIQFETNPAYIDSTWLGALYSAIANKQVVRIFYRKFDEVVEKNCIIHPYLLRQFHTRWYVFGADDEDNFLLHFALDRITRIEPLLTAAYRECTHDLIDRFEDIVGVTLYRDPRTNEALPCEDVIFWVDDRDTGYIETKPIHGSQTHIVGEEEQKLRNEHPQLYGGKFYRLEVIPNRELYQAFASYFSGIEVLAPASVRTAYAQMISDTMKKYF